MSQCPYCHDQDQQVKAGKNDSGSQRYQCKVCRRRYTPEPSQLYGDGMRQQAVKLHVDGLGYRRIARHLGVDHHSIMNWVQAHTDQLPAAPVPAESPLHIVEMDELYTYIGKKKNASMS